MNYADKVAHLDSYDLAILSSEQLAHIAVELRRCAMLLMTPFVQELKAREEHDLLALVYQSYDAREPNTPWPPELADIHQRISPPTHADAPAPLLPPDTPPAH